MRIALFTTVCSDIICSRTVRTILLTTRIIPEKTQQKLISLGYSCGKYGTDGKYGKDTVKAVKALQKAKKLKVDGVVGKNTAEALGFNFKA